MAILTLGVGLGLGAGSASGQDSARDDRLARARREAAERGFPLPEAVEQAGRSLLLNGIATRSATRFFLTADIYTAALYLPEPRDDAQTILASREPKRIRMQYWYSIEGPDMRRGWEYSFRANCPGEDCGATQAQIDLFLQGVVGVEPGDRYDYLFFPDRVDIIRNDASQGAVSGREFVELLLSTWIGDVPPTPAVKRGLLGL